MQPSELVLDFARVRAYLMETGRPHSGSLDNDLIRYDYRHGAIAIEIGMRPVTSGAGRPWLAIGIVVGPMDRFALRGALVANDELPLGALSDWDGSMILGQTLPLASTTFAHLEHAWFVLAHTAQTIAAGPTAELGFVFHAPEPR